MIGLSFERSSHMHMEELRRQAFTVAQLRQARTSARARIAATLRAWARRFEASERPSEGPWHEDFDMRAAERA